MTALVWAAAWLAPVAAIAAVCWLVDVAADALFRAASRGGVFGEEDGR